MESLERSLVKYYQLNNTLMLSTIAAKFGALAIAPSLFFGAYGQPSQAPIAQAETSHYAQANVDARASSSASWKHAELSCTTLEHKLRLGSRDRNTDGEVSELQTFLRAEGYLKSQATGFFGFSTLRALWSFQTAEGIRASGIVDAATREKIEVVSCDTITEGIEITGISAPSSLLIGEEGTWTVDVESETEGNLHYSVVWGDEESESAAARLAVAVQSSATFTHTYDTAGTYTPKFTVTDDEGISVTEAAASVSVSAEADVEITSLSITSGYAGDRVTIAGSGFTADSDVYVGSTTAADVTVNNETSITFSVPALGVGSYDVYVENENGTSNAIRFELKSKAVRISISSIDAPVRLTVDQEGTWTVNADTNLSGNLQYSVVWGDEGLMRKMLNAEATTQTSSTFTHSYADEGTYKPKFTISDGAGHSSSVSATVVVTQ